jgi:hypothetical protein
MLTELQQAQVVQVEMALVEQVEKVAPQLAVTVASVDLLVNLKVAAQTTTPRTK